MFGVPVRICKGFWVLALLCGALVTGCKPNALVLIPYVLVALVVLLVYALVRAGLGRLCMRKPMGAVLTWLGPRCTMENAEQNRLKWPEFAPLLLGGMACALGMALVVAAGLLLAAPSAAAAWEMCRCMICGEVPEVLVGEWPPLLLLAAVYAVQVVGVWAVLNVLPIYPFDCGLLMSFVLGSARLGSLLSLLVAAGLAGGALALGWWLCGGLLLALTFINYYRVFMCVADDESTKRS